MVHCVDAAFFGAFVMWMHKFLEMDRLRQFASSRQETSLSDGRRRRPRRVTDLRAGGTSVANRGSYNTGRAMSWVGVKTSTESARKRGRMLGMCAAMWAQDSKQVQEMWTLCTWRIFSEVCVLVCYLPSACRCKRIQTRSNAEGA